MSLHLKPLHRQVIVITGASSGIGLSTAQRAASRGAKVALISRDVDDLETAVQSITDAGGTAMFRVADVANYDELRAAAAKVIKRFGRIDTWVNNAGVSIYGRLEEVSTVDAQRLFETNYWGVVNGSLIALEHLKGHGGALINVGSVLSDTVLPLQGHYSASKHAVKGFTDSLRIELAEEHAPVSVTLIQPAAIDTPYPSHARNYMDVEPTHQPPVYAPELVADAILKAAVRPMRSIKVGGAAKVFTMMESIAPAVGDAFKRRTSFNGSRSDKPATGVNALHQPHPGDGGVHGDYEGRVMKRSLYTAAVMNPGRTLLGVAAMGLALGLASSTTRNSLRHARRRMLRA